jgi:hypothetical protein
LTHCDRKGCWQPKVCASMWGCNLWSDVGRAPENRPVVANLSYSACTAQHARACSSIRTTLVDDGLCVAAIRSVMQLQSHSSNTTQPCANTTRRSPTAPAGAEPACTDQPHTGGVLHAQFIVIVSQHNSKHSPATRIECHKTANSIHQQDNNSWLCCCCFC